MAKTIMIDELYIALRAPAGLSKHGYGAIRRVLDSARFGVELRRALGGVVRVFPALKTVRITVTC